eukprot:6193464-Pleurochrysis_carterae.AAC.5
MHNSPTRNVALWQLCRKESVMRSATLKQSTVQALSCLDRSSSFSTESLRRGRDAVRRSQLLACSGTLFQRRSHVPARCSLKQASFQAGFAPCACACISVAGP